MLILIIKRHEHPLQFRRIIRYFVDVVAENQAISSSTHSQELIESMIKVVTWSYFNRQVRSFLNNLMSTSSDMQYVGSSCLPSQWETTTAATLAISQFAKCKSAGFITLEMMVDPPFIGQATV